MERNSFVFYKEWKDAIRELPDDVRLEIYESVIEYATSGNLQGLKPMAAIAFNFIKQQIDRDTDKYMSIIERNKSNGSKGGRPKEPKKPTGLFGNPKEPKKPDNDDEDDNDDNFKIIYPYQDIVELWNSTCSNLAKVNALSNSRKQKIKVRLNEIGNPDEWINAITFLFEKVNQNKWLCGDNDRNWKVTFDWIFENDKNWRKVIEGNYDNISTKEKKSVYQKNYENSQGAKAILEEYYKNKSNLL